MSSIDGLSSHKEKRQKIVKKTVVKNTTVSAATPVKKTKENLKKEVPAVKTAKVQERKDFLEPVQSFDFDFDSNDINKDDLKKIKSVPEKKKHTLRWVLLGILSVLIILLVIGMVWGNDLISKITGGKSGIWDIAGLMDTEKFVDLKTDSKGRTNILVFGTSGYDMGGSEGNGTHDGAQLTDSIMMVSIDQFSGDIAMVSLPRDLKAGRTCTATGKVNEVYWCANQGGNNEEAGANALMKKVTEIFGTDFQYYVHVDWSALITIVDAIGGITVTLDEDINDYYYTGTVISAGVPTTLNGEQALGLARARHGTTLGDFSRGNSQQKILIAIKDKILSEGIDWTKALELVNAIGDNVRMDLTLEEIKTGVHLINQFDLANMRQVPILDWEQGINYMTTANIDGISYVIPSAGVNNYSDLQKYIMKMFDSDPVVREDSTIEVLNGTDESGVAATEKENLAEEGFVVKGIGDAPEGEYSGYILYVLDESKSGTKTKLEEYYHIQAKTADELPAEISSNCDFVIIVGQ